MSRSRRRPDDEPHDPNRWMVSYADFMTLLFAFFAVLYALSSLDLEKWSSVSRGVRSAFAETPGAPPPVFATGGAGSRDAGGGDPEASAAGQAAWELLLMRDHLAAVAESQRAAGDAPDPVRLHLDERGLSVTLAAGPLFASGSAELEASARPLLDEIGAALATASFELRVEGHTDERPVSNARFASNWELSSARAGAVARHLIEQSRIDPSRVGIAGYGSQRPVAGDPARDPSLDRRVEIVVLGPGAAARESAAGGRGSLEGLLDQLEPLSRSGS